MYFSDISYYFYSIFSLLTILLVLLIFLVNFIKKPSSYIFFIPSSVFILFTEIYDYYSFDQIDFNDTAFYTLPLIPTIYVAYNSFFLWRPYFKEQFQRKVPSVLLTLIPSIFIADLFYQSDIENPFYCLAIYVSIFFFIERFLYRVNYNEFISEININLFQGRLWSYILNFTVSFIFFHELFYFHNYIDGYPFPYLKYSFYISFIFTLIWLKFNKIRLKVNEENNVIENKKFIVANSLRRRANLHRVTSYFAFFLTILVLSFSAFTFYRAGEIAADDIQANSSALDQSGTKIAEKLTEIYTFFKKDEIINLKSRLQSVGPIEWGITIYEFANFSAQSSNQSVLKGKDVSDLIPYLEDLDNLVGRYNRSGESSNSLLGLVSVNSIDNNETKIGNSVNSQEKNQYSPINENQKPTTLQISAWDQVITLLPSTITRVSVAIIAIFLTKILSNLYRYSARMAAFSDGRADTLFLIEGDFDGSAPKEHVQNLAELLSGEKIDFGKQPQSPIDSTIELVDKINKIIPTKDGT